MAYLGFTFDPSEHEPYQPPAANQPTNSYSGYEITSEATRHLESHGLLISGYINTDGEWHRVKHVNDKQGKKSGFYIASWIGNHLYVNFGTWNDEVPRQNWSSWHKDRPQMSPSEIGHHQRIQAEEKARSVAKIQAVHDATAEKAKQKAEELEPAKNHRYLELKKVKAFGDARIEGVNLVLPLRNEHGEIRSYQTINMDGKKRFPFGGEKKGCFFVIPGSEFELAICEGYATGASYHMATGATVYVALDCHNLETVARMVRIKHPDTNITICADNDRYRKDGALRPENENSGIHRGKTAAKEIGAICIWPEFWRSHEENYEFDENGKPRTDFNDFHQVFGLDAIRGVLNAARQDPKNEGKFVEPLYCQPASLFDGKPVKEREWLWPGIIPTAQTTILYASGGTGKSLATQQLQTAVATGKKFLGFDVKHGPVLGIYCEDAFDELHRRQEDINNALGASYKELGNSHLCSRVGFDNLLITFSGDRGELTPFWHQLHSEVKRIRPILVIVDTAADTFGGNENIRPQVRQYIQRCLTNIATEFNCAVLLLAHPSQTGINSNNGDGGSTAWSNTVRSRLYLTRDDKTGIVTLELKKANYGKTGEKIEMVWQNGAFVPNQGIPNFVNSELKKEQDEIDALFLSLLDEFNARGQSVSDHKQGHYAPKEFYDIVKSRSLKWSKKQLEESMKRLFDTNVIHVVEKRRGHSKEITRR